MKRDLETIEQGNRKKKKLSLSKKKDNDKVKVIEVK